jgi:lactoylglutathione lyase
MPFDWETLRVTGGQAHPRHRAGLAVPFLRVANVEAALRFYVEGLGFVVTNEWSPEGRIRWCWMELDRVALMLEEHGPTPPAGPLSPGMSICILCEDAIAIYRDLRARGIEAGRPFVGNGLWVTGVTDPDGHRIEFESPATEAEETVFTGE